jgi:hypothetical protein
VKTTQVAIITAVALGAPGTTLGTSVCAECDDED